MVELVEVLLREGSIPVRLSLELSSGLLYCTVVLDLVSSVSHYIETPPLRSKAHTPAQLDISTDSTVLTVKSKVHRDLA